MVKLEYESLCLESTTTALVLQEAVGVFSIAVNWSDRGEEGGRARTMASARAPTLTLGSLDPQSTWNRWDVAGRPWHGLWAFCFLCQFGLLLDQSCMIPGWQSNRKASFGGEGGAQGYLSKAGKNPWDCCCFQSDLGDIKGRENLHWTVSVQAFCRVYVKRSLIESMHQ